MILLLAKTQKMDKQHFDDRDLAEILYMRGLSQREIASKIGKSEATISEWAKAGGWREKRAATKFSRASLVTNLLLRLDEMSREDEMDVKELAKLSRVVKELDKQIGLTEYVDCFISFGEWLQRHPEISEEIKATMSAQGTSFWSKFQKAVNDAQDKFINDLVTQ